MAIEELLREARAAGKRMKAQKAARESAWPVLLPTFSADCLDLQLKGGGRGPAKLNNVQKKVHAFAEDQLRRTGRVRIIIVKARQMGMTTYISTRFYHRMRWNSGIQSLIVTHRDDITSHVLHMHKEFAAGDKSKPALRRDNDERVAFKNGSAVTIATAGRIDTGIGRGLTFQMEHLSEMPMWSKASIHSQGIMEAISPGAGTEIWVESTARGASGPFYTMTQASLLAAASGIPLPGGFEVLFFAWHEHDEYRTPPPEGWQPGPIIEDLLKYGLDADQLYWAECKCIDLATRDGLPLDEMPWIFRQEYPSTLEEAFRAGRTGSYIAPSVVAAARLRRNPVQEDMPVLLGCDFATGGGGEPDEYLAADKDRMPGQEGGGESGDSNCFIDRQGRQAGRQVYDRFRERNTVVVANRLADHIMRIRPARVFMDKGGGGAQVYDILCDRGFGHLLELVDFGQSVRSTDRTCRNRRAQMHKKMREWLLDADIPDEHLLESELTATWVHSEDETGLLLAAKRRVRQVLKVSPDGSDALATTFAAPVLSAAGRGQWSLRGGQRRMR